MPWIKKRSSGERGQQLKSKKINTNELQLFNLEHFREYLHKGQRKDSNRSYRHHIGNLFRLPGRS